MAGLEWALLGGSFKGRARAVGVSQAVESLGAPIASQLGARARAIACVHVLRN